MNRDNRYYLEHMREHALKLRALADRTSRAEYDADETVQAACRYWLQVIGEAARGVSQDFEDAHPEIPWRAIVGMRNRIVHDYLGIDDDTVWTTIHVRVPELIDTLTILLATPDD